MRYNLKKAAIIAAVFIMAGPAALTSATPDQPMSVSAVPEGAQVGPVQIFGNVPDEDRELVMASARDHLNTLVKRADMPDAPPVAPNSASCFSVDSDSPSNMHWNDVDQFVTIDNHKCKPALDLVKNSCSAHMDLGTRCSAFCQTSGFHFFGEPIALMPGKMCRANEGCELKEEKSFRVEVSHQEVDRHVFDATVSLTPSASWGLGFKDISIPLPNIGGIGVTAAVVPGVFPPSNNQTYTGALPVRVRGSEAVRNKAKRALAANADNGGGPIHTGWAIVDSVLKEMYRQERAERRGRNRAYHWAGRYAVMGEFDDEFDGNASFVRINSTSIPNGTSAVLASSTPLAAGNTTVVFDHRPNTTARFSAVPGFANLTSTSLLSNATVSTNATMAVEYIAVPTGAGDNMLVKRGWFGDVVGKPLKKIGKKIFGHRSSSSSSSSSSGASVAVAAPASAAAAAPQQKAAISIPFPVLTNPTASVAVGLSAHWTRDWTKTYYKSMERATFTSTTHKQLPGEGCGSFWVVPVMVGYCGWQASPRVPRDIQADVNSWLATASVDELFASTFKLGSWSADGSHARGDRYPEPMWEIGPGQCPVNYHEYPLCTAAPLLDANGNALGHTVWRAQDCATGRLEHSPRQPREVREHINFDEFFRAHLLRDPRLFNPGMARQSAQSQAADDDDKWSEFDDFE